MIDLQEVRDVSGVNLSGSGNSPNAQEISLWKSAKNAQGSWVKIDSSLYSYSGEGTPKISILFPVPIRTQYLKIKSENKGDNFRYRDIQGVGFKKFVSSVEETPVSPALPNNTGWENVGSVITCSNINCTYPDDWSFDSKHEYRVINEETRLKTDLFYCHSSHNMEEGIRCSNQFWDFDTIIALRLTNYKDQNKTIIHDKYIVHEGTSRFEVVPLDSKGNWYLQRRALGLP